MYEAKRKALYKRYEDTLTAVRFMIKNEDAFENGTFETNLITNLLDMIAVKNQINAYDNAAEIEKITKG